ncbi:helix-turn-helix domain-containing protein [uncultured Clostridium sp.]|uniref:helix-turn-helix domain-containing protein n=1 Tax=uncultured Clostridium sp. TaxID=59620 RepID=UPI0028ECCEDE|nr:helix-turn-helix domain-containing protein [uncultured Clostridium sp.]
MDNYTLLSNDLIHMDMSIGAFKLYSILSTYCYGRKDSCFPSQKTLANDMGKSTRTIRRYLSELEDNDLIRIKRRGSNSSIYTLVEKTERFYIDKYKVIIDNIKTTSSKKESRSYKSKLDKFSDYPQRKYNFKLLEEALLKRDGEIKYNEVSAI